MIDSPSERRELLTRRALLGHAGLGLGSLALAWLLEPRRTVGESGMSAPEVEAAIRGSGLAGFPNFRPKAKRIIYLFQSGGPSQMDLFDPKPGLAGHRATELPDSIRRGQRLTGMTS